MRVTSPNSGVSFRHGGAYGICDECGMKFRLSEMRRRYDSALVCREDWEPRHPQEFVRGRADRIRYPGPVRPDPEPSFSFLVPLRDENDDPITENGQAITVPVSTPSQADL